MNKEIYQVLAAEDDMSEQKLLKMTAKQSGYPVSFTFLNDGEEALTYFSTIAKNAATAELPDLIILDLNLPKANGIEVLQSLKSYPRLKSIPVIILTTSNNSSDLKAAYEEGAAGYIRKPAVFEDYAKTMQRVFDYWFGTCLLL